ncbi:MAG: DUF1643 domain-containing protein [Bacteroidia bacterium]|nr:DUF1643 domain-containing protein [Bacteroidia bacterium]
MIRSAVISDDLLYRYMLTRCWQPEGRSVMFIGLNPSTADDRQDDPTIHKCIKFAKRWGYGSLVVTNLFAYRATDPKDLLNTTDPIGTENDAYILKKARQVDQIVCAWGNMGTLYNRAQEVMSFIPTSSAIRINRTGQPSHPLYLPDTSELVAYEN